MTTRKSSSSKKKSKKMHKSTGVVEPPAVNVESVETLNDTVKNNSSDRADGSSDTADRPTCGNHSGNHSGEAYIEYLGKLPPEIGTMLMLVGVAGILLPGPIGTPMLVAGAVVCWPKTFAPMERWFAKCCPRMHQEGVHQVKRYISDLNRRFPENS